MGPGKGRATPGGVGRSCCSRPIAAGTRGRRSESSAQSRGCPAPRNSKLRRIPDAGRPSRVPPVSGVAEGDKRPHVAGHPPDLFRVDHLSAQRDFSRAIVRSMKLSRCLSVSTVIFGLIFAGCAGVKPMASTGTGGSGNGSGKGGSTGSGGHITIDAGGVDLGDPTLCGNSMQDPGEKCDDGNKMGGDGCTPLCQIEKGWICPNVGQACMRNNICGDGILTAPEACDDGNKNSGDGCSGDCLSVETGWRCPVPGKPCIPICGDGVIEGSEKCDDSNTTNGDGCSSTCQVEPASTCPGTPTAPKAGKCTIAICGNGMTEARRGLRLRHRPDEVPHRLHGPERSLQRRRHRLLEDLHQGADLPERLRQDAGLLDQLRKRQHRDRRGLRRRQHGQRRRLLVDLQGRGRASPA